MIKKNYLLIIFLALLFISCGKMAETDEDIKASEEKATSEDVDETESSETDAAQEFSIYKKAEQYGGVMQCIDDNTTEQIKNYNILRDYTASADIKDYCLCLMMFLHRYEPEHKYSVVLSIYPEVKETMLSEIENLCEENNVDLNSMIELHDEMNDIFLERWFGELTAEQILALNDHFMIDYVGHPDDVTKKDEYDITWMIFRNSYMETYDINDFPSFSYEQLRYICEITADYKMNSEYVISCRHIINETFYFPEYGEAYFEYDVSDYFSDHEPANTTPEEPDGDEPAEDEIGLFTRKIEETQTDILNKMFPYKHYDYCKPYADEDYRIFVTVMPYWEDTTCLCFDVVECVSETEIYVKRFTAKYNPDDGLLYYSDEICYAETYDSENETLSESVLYENGSGTIKFDNNNMEWTDSEGNTVLLTPLSSMYENEAAHINDADLSLPSLCYAFKILSETDLTDDLSVQKSVYPLFRYAFVYQNQLLNSDLQDNISVLFKEAYNTLGDKQPDFINNFKRSMYRYDLLHNAFNKVQFKFELSGYSLAFGNYPVSEDAWKQFSDEIYELIE